MRTMTVIDLTIGAEEVPVPQHDGPTVRVTIREIREYAYRALIAAGASAGEAATAADQVLHAELQSSDGLACLVADLARGPWSRSGLGCTRRSVLHVDCGGRSGELRVGAPVVELVAGERGPAVAVTTADVPVSSMLDEPLLAAAVAAGTSVTAMRATATGAYAVRHATPEGDLAHGVLIAADLPLPPGVDGMDEAQALIVLTGADVGPALARLTCSTRGARDERRRQAAMHGVRVDEASWRVVAEHAQCFLVPEAQS
jgi:hypothetical protein